MARLLRRPADQLELPRPDQQELRCGSDVESERERCEVKRNGARGLDFIDTTPVHRGWCAPRPWRARAQPLAGNGGAGVCRGVSHVRAEGSGGVHARERV